jgi:hypothetical protein
MDKILMIILSVPMCICSILILRTSNQLLRDAKDRFKQLTGQDYDEYVKNLNK